MVGLIILPVAMVLILDCFSSRRTTMGKVGRFVTDPKAGAYCQITLDSGEKVLVSHDRGGFAGGSVTIQEVRWWGLMPGETLFQCDLGAR